MLAVEHTFGLWVKGWPKDFTYFFAVVLDFDSLIYKVQSSNCNLILDGL